MRNGKGLRCRGVGGQGKRKEKKDRYRYIDTHTYILHAFTPVDCLCIYHLSVYTYICTHERHENKRGPLRENKRTSERDKRGKMVLERQTQSNYFNLYMWKNILLIPPFSPGFRLTKNLSNSKLLS